MSERVRRRNREHAGVRRELVISRADDDAALGPGDAGGRGGDSDRGAESLLERERDPVVAAGDAVAREVAEAGGALRERGGVLVLELVGGRDGEARGDRGAGAL